jgi:ABC-type Fe3+-hydroxamate transport system substrate-binding protein
MPAYRDQTGFLCDIPAVPQRIVSLVPSQSEFLWHIGCEDQLAGITKFCIHPAEMRSTVPHVGGTKSIDIEKISRISPDLIIGNKEENEKQQIDLLRKEFPVWMSDINDLEDAYKMMLSLGEILGKRQITKQLVNDIKSSLEPLKGLFSGLRVAYLMWYRPYMVAASGTYIHNVLTYLGFENVFRYSPRYPEITENDLKDASPDVCLLSSEPFPFAEKHRAELKKILPGSKIILSDGEAFSWYGPRMLTLAKHVKEIQGSLNT